MDDMFVDEYDERANKHKEETEDRKTLLQLLSSQVSTPGPVSVLDRTCCHLPTSKGVCAAILLSINIREM